MALEDLKAELKMCNRCSYCKFVPYMKMDNREYENVCPSVARYNFHAYSCSGRLHMALSLLEERIDISDAMLDMIYICQMDGACDISCKNQRDMEPLEAILQLRAKCVEEGQLLPAHMIVIDGLRKEDNMMQKPKAERGKWIDGLNVKDLTREQGEVLFHAGCRYSFDESLRPIVRKAITLLQKAGVDVGVMGKEETCCGGRAYEMGYQAELSKYAEHNTQNWKTTGVKTVVTPCADCYAAFKVLYEKIGIKSSVEVLHLTEYLHRLIEEGTLRLSKEIPMTVTYHDPCHLGRLGEPWIHWEGVETKLKEGLVGLIIQEPPKEFRKGANGVYDIPREIIKSIPGINLIEMDRIREYAWCCGAGGGVLEAYPDFALWTAAERIKEAQSTGAEAIVTACGWCERNFHDAIKENGNGMKVYDIVDVLEEAI